MKIAILVALTSLLSASGFGAQATGTLSGTATDASNAPLPGVRIIATAGKFQRTTVTRTNGRYRLLNVPAGRYTIKAELAGFETSTKEDIDVEAGAAHEVSFVLHAGCLADVDYVDPGLVPTVRQSDTTVLHIRVLSAHEYERCPAKLYCACTDYEAIVQRVVKPGKSDVRATRISLLHEGAKRYVPGDEYVAFLHWNPTASRFLIWGPTYMFPVRDGRVQVNRHDARSVSSGMTVDEFTAALQRLLRNN